MSPPASSTTTSVPSWLHGVWCRNWIKRYSPSSQEITRPSDINTTVLYVQSRYFFVDVRNNESDKAGILAFGGVTAVAGSLVKWHQLLELNQPPASFERWENAMKGRPDSTEDTGEFTLTRDNEYMETAPDGSLAESWSLITHKTKDTKELAMVRKQEGIFVVVGDKWAVADGELYCAGRVDGWIVEVDPTGILRAGSTLKFPSKRRDWKVMDDDGIVLPDELF